MTYKFEQFKIEIVDPIIEVNLNTIQDKAIDQLLSVSLTLSTDSSTFGVTANYMPYTDTWEDNDVEGMVFIWLKQFEI